MASKSILRSSFAKATATRPILSAASLCRQSRLKIPTTTCIHPKRSFQTTIPRLKSDTVEQLKSRYKHGPFSIASAGFFVLCGLGMWYYFEYEKGRMVRKRIRDASKGVGKPKIGGEFALVDQNGQLFTSEDMKGKFALVYFGFTNCPDICPDELDKMARMIDQVRTRRGNVMRPIFVTCDPARDSPAVIKEYLAEFHPGLIGLTGSWEDIRAMCKAYRVYFSTPPHVKPGQDYLVDHSIYFYLMDPEGDFIEVIGREHTAERGAKVVTDHIDKFLGRTVTPESYKELRPTQLDGRVGKGVKHNVEVT